ncbi:hypothetical protein ABT095_14240 [Kitasatospora sp. NPDC002227]
MDIETTETEYVTPAVDDLGEIGDVTLGSGGFNNKDSTMYWQG